MGYMTLPDEELARLDVSSRAREAVTRFRPPWGGDVREILEDNWRESVSPYFDELLAAVADRERPVPQGYFDSGFSLPCNPLFMILDPKCVHGLCDALARETGAFDAVGASVFLPYVAKWETLLRLLAERFGRLAGIEAVGAKLRLVVDALRRAADLERGRAEPGLYDYFDRYSAFRNAFQELGRAIDEGGDVRGREDVVPSAPAPAGAPRRHYDKYCLTSRELADMFGVKIKTIGRWKKEASDWGDLFRRSRDSVRGMRALADMYLDHEAEARARRKGTVRFDENLHGRR